MNSKESRIWVNVIPVIPSKWGAAILKGNRNNYEVLLSRYDFDTKRKALNWINKHFYKLKADK